MKYRDRHCSYQRNLGFSPRNKLHTQNLRARPLGRGSRKIAYRSLQIERRRCTSVLARNLETAPQETVILTHQYQHKLHQQKNYSIQYHGVPVEGSCAPNLSPKRNITLIFGNHHLGLHPPDGRERATQHLPAFFVENRRSIFIPVSRNCF